MSFSDAYTTTQSVTYPSVNTIGPPVSGVLPNSLNRTLNTIDALPGSTNGISSGSWNIQTNSTSPSQISGISCTYTTTTPINLSASTFLLINVNTLNVVNTTPTLLLTISDGGMVNPATNVLLTSTGLYAFPLNPTFTSVLPNVLSIDFKIGCEASNNTLNFSADIRFDSLRVVTLPTCPFYDYFITEQPGNTNKFPPVIGVVPAECTRSVIANTVATANISIDNLNKLLLFALTGPSDPNAPTVLELNYLFDSPYIDMTCVNVIQVSFLLKELINASLELNVTITDSSATSETHQATFGSGNAIITMSQYVNINKMSIENIKFSFLCTPQTTGGYKLSAESSGITSIYNSTLTYMLINPYKCNNGMIKVTSKTSLPPYTLTCPNGKQVVNNTGVFYVVDDGMYTLSANSSSNNTCCDSNPSIQIKVSTNNCWC